ncbi:MAG: multidrug effflux MFS transporter, partial [Gluconobacter sp.]
MTEQSMAFRRGDTIPGWLPLMLGIFTAVGPVSTDIYLPALPEMERQLHSAPGSGSITMAAWVIGLAIGQITIGPVSDRFGRRLPLLIGMIGYTIGEIGCALAPTMTIMCICRVFSALMASAGLVIPNACLRDLTEGDEASRLMSRLIVVQGVVPILAPMLGGFALKFVDWRVIFWATAVYGGLCTLMLLTVFPETLPTQERRDMRPLSIIERYIYILRTRSFITNGLVWSFLGFVTFTYLTGAPTLFEERFGMSPFHYGMLFGLFAVCMIGASAINGLVVGKVSTTHMLFSALGISLTGSILFLALAVISAVDLTAGGQLRSFFLWPLIISLVITMAPTGIIGPNS